MKKTICAALFAALAFGAFSDDYLFFGANYSNTIADKNVSHAIGGNFSSIGDYGGAKKLYAALGFNYELTNRANLISDDFKKLGVNGLSMKSFALPIRIGYPVIPNITERTRFVFIPSLAFDILFFKASFSQSISGYNLNYNLSAFGYSLGISANIGMMHQIGKAYLRYGVDLDMPFFTMLIYNISWTGSASGATKDSQVSTIADYLTLTTSPYVAVGFRLR